MSSNNPLPITFGHIPSLTDDELAKAIQAVDTAKRQLAQARNRLLQEQIRRQG